jgi:Zn-dependent protease with chaperone function
MAVSRQPSMLGRAILAVSLMIGFYAMALALAGGLLWIAYASVRSSRHGNAKLLIFCVAGALIILWSILPRPDRFVPPGPRLQRHAAPKLFAELETIARPIGQPLPVEVYVVPDVNAFVSQRGGVMGFGSRRIMGVGLPLLRLLTVGQLRGVLAHEFGHYHGGDVKLGPWIYKTQEAVFRTMENLSEHTAILSYPFVGFAKLFMRVTLAISRRQELAADALAAGLVGARAFGEGLKTVHAAGPAYQPYVESELLPVLDFGFRPPLAEGFSRFMKSPRIASIAEKAIQEEMASRERNPYDSHPSLPERLAAIASLPPGEPAAEDPPAISLLEDVAAIETTMLTMMTERPDLVTKLKPISWDRVAQEVWIPRWKEVCAGAVEPLRAILVGEMGEAVGRTAELGRRSAREPITQDEANVRGRAVLGGALTLCLVREGWSLNADPGAEVSVRRGADVLEPFDEVARLIDRKRSAEEWRSQCAALGIGELNLARGLEG